MDLLRDGEVGVVYIIVGEGQRGLDMVGGLGCVMPVERGIGEGCVDEIGGIVAEIIHG